MKKVLVQPTFYIFVFFWGSRCGSDFVLSFLFLFSSSYLFLSSPKKKRTLPSIPFIWHIYIYFSSLTWFFYLSTVLLWQLKRDMIWCSFELSWYTWPCVNLSGHAWVRCLFLSCVRILSVVWLIIFVCFGMHSWKLGELRVSVLRKRKKTRHECRFVPFQTENACVCVWIILPFHPQFPPPPPFFHWLWWSTPARKRHKGLTGVFHLTHKYDVELFWTLFSQFENILTLRGVIIRYFLIHSTCVFGPRFAAAKLESGVPYYIRLREDRQCGNGGKCLRLYAYVFLLF